MNLPLELLLNNEKNIYELTCVMIKRAKQLEKIKRTDDEDKISILAIEEILEESIEYIIDDSSQNIIGNI